MSQNQINLFNLISNFTVDTVLGWVSRMYKTFGKTITGGNALPSLLLPFAETYFNQVAQCIYSREDEYINSKFDEMCAINLEGNNIAIDILQIIVMLSLDCLHNLNIRDVLTDDHTTSLNAVKVHLVSLIKKHSNLAKELNGCSIDHIHKPITPGEKVYTFTIDRFVNTDKGPVKLTRLDM